MLLRQKLPGDQPKPPETETSSGIRSPFRLCEPPKTLQGLPDPGVLQSRQPQTSPDLVGSASSVHPTATIRLTFKIKANESVWAGIKDWLNGRRETENEVWKKQKNIQLKRKHITKIILLRKASDCDWFSRHKIKLYAIITPVYTTKSVKHI